MKDRSLSVASNGENADPFEKIWSANHHDEILSSG